MIYDEIKKLKPYFFSIREIDDTVSLDMKFPVRWKCESDDSSINVITQDKNEQSMLISFIAASTKEGYGSVIGAVQDIIKRNIEEEEKEKLFQGIVGQLRELFINESLDKLKEINLFNNDKKENA